MKSKVGSVLIILLLLVIGALLLAIGSEVLEIKEMLAPKDRINREANALPQVTDHAIVYNHDVSGGVYVNLQNGYHYHSSKRCYVLEYYEYKSCTSVTIKGASIFDPELLTPMTLYEAEYRGFKPCPSCRNAYNKADAVYDIVYDKLY